MDLLGASITAAFLCGGLFGAFRWAAGVGRRLRDLEAFRDAQPAPLPGYGGNSRTMFD